MDRLEKLIKELPREIQQNFVHILEFIIQKKAQQDKTAPKSEPRIPTVAPPIASGSSQKKAEIGQAKADVVRLFKQALIGVRKGRIGAVKADFLHNYNLGTLAPQVYDVLGRKSLSSLERWTATMRKSGDPSDLVPKHGEHRKGKTKMTAEQERCLQEVALRHPDWSMIDVVRQAKKMMLQQGVKDNCSDATYLRYLKQWRT